MVANVCFSLVFLKKKILILQFIFAFLANGDKVKLARDFMSSLPAGEQSQLLAFAAKRDAAKQPDGKFAVHFKDLLSVQQAAWRCYCNKKLSDG